MRARLKAARGPRLPPENELVPADELHERVHDILNGYYLIGVRRDRESFYALSEDDLKDRYGCLCGLFLNYVMDGELDKAWKIIEGMDEDYWLRHTFILVFPGVSLSQFLKALWKVKELKIRMKSIISAGRPTVLNGVMDFTRLGPFLEGKKDLFIDGISWLYDPDIAPATYELGLAEWYYQNNRVAEAGKIVRRIIKEFDNETQRRLMFVALYLKAKVEFASDKIPDAYGYIKSVRRFAHYEGELEFSYNIDAAETYAALFDGKYEIVSGWLASEAPNEFDDFCMLDLYRYMIKIRCYIVNKKYMSVVALAERLRPLLQEGRRTMDLCEMDLLLSVCYFRTEEKELACVALGRALRLARRRGYFRLLADEGPALLPLLVHYIKTRGETPWLMSLLEVTRSVAASYPLYLKPINRGGAVFSKTEISILKFLEQGKDKKDLAKFFFLSENTIKFHLKNIYRKLDAGSAYQAVWEARLLGII
ncbi:MAG: hypothetical protein IJL80_03230 [Treponema sp.]|nr:hypothetical protein [Treponema sp.]